jgi:hypothetical protein
METQKLSFEERMELFMAALEKSRVEAEEDMKQFREQIAISSKERAASSADFDKRMKSISEQLGGIGNNNGYFAEEFFYNSIRKGTINFFGEPYDRIMKNITGFVKPDEYDIVMVNGKSACIIETKYKANEKHIENVLKKAETFRYNFREYKDHILYLGLASMAFYKYLEDECQRRGIAIIKQVGDVIVINHEHLKEY